MVVVCAIGSAETPPVAKERFHEILKLKGDGAYARALEEAKQLAREHPDFEAVHRSVVDLYLLLDDVVAAGNYFETWVESEPRSAYAYYGLGRIDLHVGELDAAIEKLQRAVSLAPDFAEPIALQTRHRRLVHRRTQPTQAPA